MRHSIFVQLAKLGLQIDHSQRYDIAHYTDPGVRLANTVFVIGIASPIPRLPDVQDGGWRARSEGSQQCDRDAHGGLDGKGAPARQTERHGPGRMMGGWYF
jgi:hypothetical protein